MRYNHLNDTGRFFFVFWKFFSSFSLQFRLENIFVCVKLLSEELKTWILFEIKVVKMKANHNNNERKNVLNYVMLIKILNIFWR